MESGSINNALRQIETLYTVGTLSGRSDAQLLELFVARQGTGAEEAFAALVERHGPAVLGVCRRMLPSSHDCEDAFQATFLVLARRAASIGRRERLASWLYGVAVRTAKESRRRAALQRAGEKRLMELSRVEPEPTEDRNDVIAFLDEELNRLPDRYRAALVTCELQGKSRREAATQLGVPEGTLSTHLARGRKLLRERLVRRGVNLGAAPFAGLSRPLVEAAVPERLLGLTVQATLGFLSGSTAARVVPSAVATLAERVLKLMFLTRLTVILASLTAAGTGAVAAVLLCFAAMAAGMQNPDPPKPGPNDVPGRVVDQSGAGVPGVQVWAIEGPGWTPTTVAKTTTDSEGRFVVPWPPDARGLRDVQNFAMFAQGRDGRVGWQHPAWLNTVDGKRVEIELKAVGDVPGRLTDQNGRPIAGVEVAPELISRSGQTNSGDFIRLSAELTALLRTTTAADGSFVLKGIPQGAGIFATIASPAFGSPTISWDTARPVTIVLDGRLGRIKGRLKPPDTRALPDQLGLGLYGSPLPAGAVPGPYEVFCRRDGTADKDGVFQFDGLPPGRYTVSAYFDSAGIIATKPEFEIEVGPGALAQLEIPLQRLPKITGRLVDAQTGKGIAGVSLVSLLREEGKNSNIWCGEATTDAEGRYRIPARPGKILINLKDVPKTHLRLDHSEFPSLDVKTDQTWPELKLSPAIGLDGIVVDRTGKPVAGAEVFVDVPDPPGVHSHDLPIVTGPGGTFHIDQLEPDDAVSLHARAGGATTDGAIVVETGAANDRRKITLTLDTAHACRIRGLVTDLTGKRIAGAQMMLRWHRSYVSKKPNSASGIGSPIAMYTTTDNGLFVFRDLWPGDRYSIVIEARGHARIETPELTGKAGETLDAGKIVLANTSGYLAGRVIGSDGKPIAGANIFNHGDAPQPVATASDSQGRFRLEGVFPGRKYAFIRKEGYRFKGIKADQDADGLTITLKKTSEPPTRWKPGSASSYEDQVAFARGVLIRLWEKYGADPEKTGASQCIDDMALIDAKLALEWSLQHGHRYDEAVRLAQAGNLADTDTAAALALLKKEPVSASQPILHSLAQRYTERDPNKAMLFAEEAAVQAQRLIPFERPPAMAQAGVVLIKLGRAEDGRKLIDEAARDAAKFLAKDREGYYRSLVAEALAPFDLKQALALIEPIADDDNMPTAKSARYAGIATAIAKSDTTKAIALLDAVAGPSFHHELARTEVAYKIGADRPDTAIKIIEGINRNRWAAQYQAAAFGWLAVALAPRDPARAFALIDRALAMTIEHSGGRETEEEIAVAARIALCARRIGYPDMESVVMRVMATRSVGDSPWERNRLVRPAMQAALALALIDPDAARTVLEQTEARSELDAMKDWNIRVQWLMAWSLVDLKRAEALIQAGLTELDGAKDMNLGGTGIFQLVEFLLKPLDRREDVLGEHSVGGFWWKSAP